MNKLINKVINPLPIFNLVLLFIVIILSIASLFAIIEIHWTLINTFHILSFNPTGINNYLSAYGTHQTLFITTLSAIAGYLGFFRTQIATITANNKIKEDRFNEWKAVLDVRFMNVDHSDPEMRKEFIKIRNNLFSQLYDMNFKISDRKMLTHIFENNFSKRINFFETHNRKFLSSSGLYPDRNFSYSFDSFRFLFMGCIDDKYPEIIKDLRELYLLNLSNERNVDSLRFLKINDVCVDYDDL